MIKVNSAVPEGYPVTISFNTMRRMIGILGMALPLLLLAWSALVSDSPFILDSISSYYHTDARDLFVGIMCVISFFLLYYRGYDLLDFIAFKLAGTSALGIAFFPANMNCKTNCYIHLAPNLSPTTNLIHFISAAIFFVTLAYVSMFLFTKTDPRATRGEMTPNKRRRNVVFVLCGAIIALCVASLVLVDALPENSRIYEYNPIFWIETLASLSFGFSWIVKSEVLFMDTRILP
jgi:hypothetical protein